MYVRVTKCLCFILLAFLLMAPNAFASGSGAFRLFANDAEAMGKAGAFVGEADNASAVYYNPAGMTQLDGNNLSLGFAWGNVFVDHTSPAGDTTQMGRENIVVPHFYYVTDLNTDDLALGFSVKSNFGASTDWAEDSFARYVSTKTEVEDVDFLMNFAYQVNDQWSVGAGVNATSSKFSQGKNVFQAGTPDAEAQLKLHDTFFSQNVSTLFKFNEKHQLGFQWRSQGDVSYAGEVDAHALTGTLAAIFGGSEYQTDITWNVSFPQSAVVGYSFRPNDKWIINFDAEWSDWSSLEQENINFPKETSALRISTLNSLADLDLDWDSSWAYSIGGEYSLNEKIRLRSGYFFHETPIPDVNFNTFLPDSDAHGVNLGAGYTFNDAMGLDFAWTGVFFQDRDLALTTHDSAVSSVIGNYEEYINVATLTFNWKFGD